MEKWEDVLRLRLAIVGVETLDDTVPVELRLVAMAPFWGRLERLGRSSRYDRALSSKGFTSGGGTVSGNDGFEETGA